MTMWLVKPGHATLQTRGLQADDSCVLRHTMGEVQLWVGRKCSDAIADGARRHCEYLTKYEGASKHQEARELYAESFTGSLREADRYASDVHRGSSASHIHGDHHMTWGFHGYVFRTFGGRDTDPVAGGAVTRSSHPRSPNCTVMDEMVSGDAHPNCQLSTCEAVDSTNIWFT